jgi:flagellar hook protein FlgE
MSFTQGLSGLQAASTDLSVVGNNVANVNTVGFKQSEAQFADVYAASLGGAGGTNNQIGIGTQLATVAQQFSEGSITSTNNPLDMAVNGAGFFIMHGVNGTSYSRNGQFQVDKNGNIVNSTGQNLQGWPATNGIVANGGPTSNLTISNASIPPVATTTINMGMNLSSTSSPISAPFDPLNTNTYNYSTSTTVYDSLGNSLLNTVYFQYAAPAVASAGAGAATPAPVTITGATPAAAPNTFTVANTAGLVPGEEVTFSDGFTTTVSGVASDGVTFTTAATDPNAYGGGLTAAFGPASITNVNSSTSFTVDNAYGLSVGQAFPPAPISRPSIRRRA